MWSAAFVRVCPFYFIFWTEWAFNKGYVHDGMAAAAGIPFLWQREHNDHDTLKSLLLAWNFDSRFLMVGFVSINFL